MGNIDTLDTKASIILGIDGVVIAALFGLLKDIDNVASLASKGWHPYLIPCLAILSALLTSVSAMLALLASQVRTYKDTIEPRTVYEQNIESCVVDEAETKRQLLYNYIDAYEKNRTIIHRKAVRVKGSLRCLLVALVLSTVAIVLTLAAGLVTS